MARARDAQARNRIVEVEGPRYVVIELAPRRARLRRTFRELFASDRVRDVALVAVTLLLVGFLIVCFGRAASAPGPSARGSAVAGS